MYKVCSFSIQPKKIVYPLKGVLSPSLLQIIPHILRILSNDLRPETVIYRILNTTFTKGSTDPLLDIINIALRNPLEHRYLTDYLSQILKHARPPFRSSETFSFKVPDPRAGWTELSNFAKTPY